MTANIVFLFDVDNTLLDNDAFQNELEVHLHVSYGELASRRYWAIFERLRVQSGYADYLGALEQYRLEELHDSRMLRMANWLLDYPFADRLYPGVWDAINHAKKHGVAVILSDGDAVFQPRKIDRSGLWTAFRDDVLIYIHKQNELHAVERAYPAKHYVIVDDKLSILDAIKQRWGPKVTTVFHRRGHYALDAAAIAKLPPADITIDRIGDLTKFDVWPPRRV